MTLISKLRRRLACLIIAAAVPSPALAGATEAPPTPDPQDLIDLVRETVLTVDRANKSGDYAPLRALGAKDFQDAISADRLAKQFTDLRASGLDMSPIAALTPMTAGAPRLDRNGLLRILGFFEMGKTQLVYDLLYAYDGAGQRWRVAALSIKPRPIAEPPKLMQPQ